MATKGKKRAMAAVNPRDVEAGELASLITETVKLLNKESDIQEGKTKHVLPGAMPKRLEALGIHVTNVHLFLQITKELNAIVPTGVGKAAYWSVIDASKVSKYVTEAKVDAARMAVLAQKASVKAPRKSKAKRRKKKATAKTPRRAPAKAPEVSTQQPESATNKIITFMAEVISRLKDVESRLKLLEEQPSMATPSASDVAAALLAQFKH